MKKKREEEERAKKEDEEQRRKLDEQYEKQRIREREIEERLREKERAAATDREKPKDAPYRPRAMQDSSNNRDVRDGRGGAGEDLSWSRDRPAASSDDRRDYGRDRGGFGARGGDDRADFARRGDGGDRDLRRAAPPADEGGWRRGPAADTESKPDK